MLFVQDVHKVQCNRDGGVLLGLFHDEQFDGSHTVGRHDRVGNTVSSFFRDVSGRETRRSEIRSRLQELVLHRSGADLCKSADSLEGELATTHWNGEKTKFEEHMALLTTNMATIKDRLAESGSEIETKVVKQFVAEVRELEPCIQLKNDKKVVIDQDFMLMLEHGPDKSHSTDSMYIELFFRDATEVAKQALLSSKGLKEYEQASKCTLQTSENRVLASAFRAMPTCDNDCKHPDLNVESLPSSAQSDSCSGQSVAAVGSGEWHHCGAHATSCTNHMGLNHDVCCCKAGWLNGSPKDVEAGSVCGAECASGTAEGGARAQRVFEYRAKLLAEEAFSSTCDYGHPMAPWMRGNTGLLAKHARAALEKEYYNLAFPGKITIDEAIADVEDVQEEAFAREVAKAESTIESLIEESATSLLEWEEQTGSFVDLSSDGWPADAAAAVLGVVVEVVVAILWCILVGLCLLAAFLMLGTLTLAMLR